MPQIVEIWGNIPINKKYVPLINSVCDEGTILSSKHRRLLSKQNKGNISAAAIKYYSQYLLSLTIAGRGGADHWGWG